MKLTNRLLLMTRLRVCGDVLPFPHTSSPRDAKNQHSKPLPKNGSDLRITLREPLKNTVLHTWLNVLHCVKVKVKAKQSLHNPGQALGVAGS